MGGRSHAETRGTGDRPPRFPRGNEIADRLGGATSSPPSTACSRSAPTRSRFSPVKLTIARQFVEAVASHDFEVAAEFLDPDVETVTPRNAFRGIPACRHVLLKASGDEQFTMAQSEPQLEERDGDVVARIHETARWRETGEVAYEREVAVRLTLDDERIVRVVVMPGGAQSSWAQ